MKLTEENYKTVTQFFKNSLHNNIKLLHANCFKPTDPRYKDILDTVNGQYLYAGIDKEGELKLFIHNDGELSTAKKIIDFYNVLQFFADRAYIKENDDYVYNVMSEKDKCMAYALADWFINNQLKSRLLVKETI